MSLKIESAASPEDVLLYLSEDEEFKESRMDINEAKTAECGELSDRVYEYTVTTPTTPGLMWYYFKVVIDENNYYYGNNSKKLGGWGQITRSKPPLYQITVHRKELATPDWFKRAVVYQIFVDRFYNGAEDGEVLNPKKNSVIHSHWDNTPFYIRDRKTGEVVRWDFFGGNLNGVIEKLPYLKDLGIDVIYLNPIFEAASNHKYDTGDYKKVDPMFGDNELYAKLCSKAEDMGIRIILDGVFSHTGSDSRYFNREDSYDELGAYQSPDSPYFSWYNFYDYPDGYDSWWGVEDLPAVNEMEPSYIDFILQDEDSVIKYWMNKGTMGWRLDVADELPPPFLKLLNKTVKDEDPKAVLIGEVWEDASSKVSYDKRREYLLGDELDSVTNYPFRRIMIDFLLGYTDAFEVHRELMSLYENYPLHHFYSVLNLIGSHDVPRVLTILSESPPSEEFSNEKEKAYYKPSSRELELGFKRLKLLTLCQMTFPGVPAVYYGDEAGMLGYEDPYCRGTFPWGNENRELQNWYKKIIGLRNDYLMLKTGEWFSLPLRDDLYGYVRRITGGQDPFGKEGDDGLILVLMYRSRNRDQKIKIDLGRWFDEDGIMIDMLSEKKQHYPINKGILDITLKTLEGKLLMLDN